MSKINKQKQDSVKIYKIRKTLDELTQQVGHGKEFISVYSPKNKRKLEYNVSELIIMCQKQKIIRCELKVGRQGLLFAQEMVRPV